MTINRAWSKPLLTVWTGIFLLFLYIPIVTVIVVALADARYFRFPVSHWSFRWFIEAFNSSLVRELHWTSLFIAVLVTLFASTLGFFGALAFARYEWNGRSLYQKLILVPIFFPQAVLALALLLWFTYLDIIPSWKTAVFAHLVWIVPIVTLVISIQVFGFDVKQEEAAFDLGATRFQVFRDITLPNLAPGLFSGMLFAFLLSWGNFPLSAYTSGADSTVPEWLFSKMSAAYTPMVMAVGALSIVAAAVIFLIFYVVLTRRDARGLRNERLDATVLEGERPNELADESKPQIARWTFRTHF